MINMTCTNINVLIITHQNRLINTFHSTHSITLHLNMNGTGNGSDSASQMDASLMLPVFLSSHWAKKHAALIHDIRTGHNERQCLGSATKILNFTSTKVRMQPKPHLTAVC